jgi:hypothetical protein
VWNVNLFIDDCDAKNEWREEVRKEERKKGRY